MSESTTEAKPCPLIEAIQTASEADLAVINARIAALERELNETTHRIEGEIAALRAAEHLVELRLYGKQEKQQRRRRSGAGNGLLASLQPRTGQRASSVADDEPDAEPDDERLAVRIVKLLNIQGPMAIQVIANRLEEPLQAVAVAVSRSSKLRRDDDKISVVQPLLPRMA